MTRSKKEQQQFLMLGGILALLAMVLGYQFIRPAMTRARDTAGPALGRVKADLDNLRRQLDRLPEVEQATSQQRAAVVALTARLAQSATLDTLLADVSVMAREAHVRIESLEPLESAGPAQGSEGLYAEVPIEIHAAGGYHQLGAFLNAIESHARLMRLVRLEITGNADEPWRQSAQLIVSTYRLLEPKEATP